MALRSVTPWNDTATPSLSSLIQFRREARERFLAGRKAETQYANRLRQVAKQIDVIVRGIAPDGILSDATLLRGLLERYAEILTPWGEIVAERMIADVSKRDAAAWAAHGRLISQGLRKEIEGAPIGIAFQRYKAEQVKAIRSIPLDAAERLHKLSIEAFTGGKRASEVAQQILESGNVARSHAMMLARTGVSGTATALTRARAEFVGSDGYIWRTARDGDVRKSHREMEGRFVPWNDPPTLDGFKGHCGEFANCRCFPEVVLPERRARA